MHVDKKDCISTVYSWSLELAKLNSAFSRVARCNIPTAPTSQALGQDILRHWERAAREQSVMCNQAAGLSRCLTRAQDMMSTQLKSLHVDKGKGKSSERMQQAVDELEYLVLKAHFLSGLPQKKGVNPNYCHKYTEIKYVKDVSCVGHLSSVNLVTNAPTATIDLTVGARLHQSLGKMGSPGGESQGSNSTQRGLHPPLQVQTQPNQISNYRKQLYQPSQKSQPFGGPVSAGEQKCSRTGRKSKLPVVLQMVIFGSQTKQPVETNLGPEHLEHQPKHRGIKNGETRDNKNLPTGRGVGHFHRFQGHILPHTNLQSVQEVHAFSRPGSVLPVQSPTLWSVHSTHGVHSGGQYGHTDGFTKGKKNPPVPRRLFGESNIPPNLFPAYPNLGSSLSRTRLAGEQGKVRTGPKTDQLRRLPV